MIIKLTVFAVGTPTLADCTYEFNTDNAIGIGIPTELIKELQNTVSPILRIDVLRHPDKPLTKATWEHRNDDYGVPPELDNPVMGGIGFKDPAEDFARAQHKSHYGACTRCGATNESERCTDPECPPYGYQLVHPFED